MSNSTVTELANPDNKDLSTLQEKLNDQPAESSQVDQCGDANPEKTSSRNKAKAQPKKSTKNLDKVTALFSNDAHHQAEFTLNHGARFLLNSCPKRVALHMAESFRAYRVEQFTQTDLCQMVAIHLVMSEDDTDIRQHTQLGLLASLAMGHHRDKPLQHCTKNWFKQGNQQHKMVVRKRLLLSLTCVRDVIQHLVVLLRHEPTTLRFNFVQSLQDLVRKTGPFIQSLGSKDPLPAATIKAPEFEDLGPILQQVRRHEKEMCQQLPSFLKALPSIKLPISQEATIKWLCDTMFKYGPAQNFSEQWNPRTSPFVFPVQRNFFHYCDKKSVPSSLWTDMGIQLDQQTMTEFSLPSYDCPFHLNNNGGDILTTVLSLAEQVTQLVEKFNFPTLPKVVDWLTSVFSIQEVQATQLANLLLVQRTMDLICTPQLFVSNEEGVNFFYTKLYCDEIVKDNKLSFGEKINHVFDTYYGRLLLRLVLDTPLHQGFAQLAAAFLQIAVRKIHHQNTLLFSPPRKEPLLPTSFKGPQMIQAINLITGDSGIQQFAAFIQTLVEDDSFQLTADLYEEYFDMLDGIIDDYLKDGQRQLPLHGDANFWQFSLFVIVLPFTQIGLHPRSPIGAQDIAKQSMGGLKLLQVLFSSSMLESEAQPHEVITKMSRFFVALLAVLKTHSLQNFWQDRELQDLLPKSNSDNSLFGCLLLLTRRCFRQPQQTETVKSQAEQSLDKFKNLLKDDCGSPKAAYFYEFVTFCAEHATSAALTQLEVCRNSPTSLKMTTTDILNVPLSSWSLPMTSVIAQRFKLAKNQRMIHDRPLVCQNHQAQMAHWFFELVSIGLEPTRECQFNEYLGIPVKVATYRPTAEVKDADLASQVRNPHIVRRDQNVKNLDDHDVPPVKEDRSSNRNKQAPRPAFNKNKGQRYGRQR